MGTMEAVNAALASWINGEIVADQQDDNLSERRVVFKNDNGYSIARGFPVGDKAHVSIDLADKTADQVIAHLLEGN